MIRAIIPSMNEILIKGVCAWCNPGRSVLGVYQDWMDTAQISHGICPDHLAEQRRAILGHKKPGERTMQTLTGLSCALQRHQVRR